MWLWLLLGLLALAAPAGADTVTLNWDPAPGATSYDVQKSTDFNMATGAGTWTNAGTVQSSACTGNPVTCAFTDNAAPATGGVFYRLVPKNASGTNTLNKQGTWYCGGCAAIPGKPTSLGLTY